MVDASSVSRAGGDHSSRGSIPRLPLLMPWSLRLRAWQGDGFGMMVEQAHTTGFRDLPSQSGEADCSPCAPSTLRLELVSSEHVAELQRSLSSLFFGSSNAVVVRSSSGIRREDLDAEEIAQRIAVGLVDSMEFRVELGGEEAAVRVTSPGAGLLSIELPVVLSRSTSRLWLQCDPDVLTTPRLLCLATHSNAFALDGLHGLLGLASSLGGLRQATLESAAADPVAKWATSDPSDGALPLVASLNQARWAPSEDGPEAATLWFEPQVLDEDWQSPDESWWSTFDELVRAPRASMQELRVHLSRAFDIPWRWNIVDLATAPNVRDAVLPEVGLIARVIPTPDKLLMALDLDQPPQVIADSLLHLAGHLAIGHVRPGDETGHWDTAASVSPTGAQRVWDRQVRDLLDTQYRRPSARRVSSLEECTPLEKAWLVLLDHIGRMVGEARTLHEAAERYQAAAYQRQAAQRLVAQLEDYGGAMLCDGVGLGKTYVATTVMVHYANSWRELLAEDGRSFSDDPFRITVLSPNSVVTTWQREAIPPLGAHGVVPATIRVLSHTKLSRILPTSQVIQRTKTRVSDMEHLLLSDLVIVDEAHNFRSVGARRTVVLRDLLRLQPRKDLRRKVLLLTATPVNNSLEDLRQQAALLFSKPLWFNDNLTADGYRSRVFTDIDERLNKVGRASGDVASILIHGSSKARFSYAPDFRDDVQFGVQVPRVGDYLKEQEKRLAQQQLSVRAAMQSGAQPQSEPVRIAGELLDRIVVQRSRALCKQIEREQGSNVKLLFRPDAPEPEKLIYEDVYDNTRDVLARFLPLFETGEGAHRGPVPPLSLKVYQWADVRDGIRDASEVSSVVGLQRVLVLKRLESSPVAFLITLLRLLALYAHRIKQLIDMCTDLGERTRGAALEKQVLEMLEGVASIERDRLDLLLTGRISTKSGKDLLNLWSKAHMGARSAADSDDPPPPQLTLFHRQDSETRAQREMLNRLWELRDDLVQDLDTLLNTAPGLAEIVFGAFEERDWPRKFIAGGQAVDWPESAGWAQRLVTDGKLRRLILRLLRARANGQKAIVFSQFTDTLAYISSVLQASSVLGDSDWRRVLRSLNLEAGQDFTKADVEALVRRTDLVSGDTDDRDLIIHAFAPYYRLGPSRPSAHGASAEVQAQLIDLWRQGWTNAIRNPIDVLLATDVLAEGVNLQDAALLVNYDVHWNPVRMIQRSGRIDRRLNPAIEEATLFPDLEGLARSLGLEVPAYWWHQHPDAAPLTVNLLLPDELEEELQLRERIANKTLAIDFTLGLEQGTGAEAEWMADYRYHGISALNAWQGDRAIERVAGHQERLKRLLAERTISPGWVEQWNGWLREDGASADAPLVAWARIGRVGGELVEHVRRLRPVLADGTPHWLWTTEKPVDEDVNAWFVLDGRTWPPTTRTDLGWDPDASRPIAADDLAYIADRLVAHDGIHLQELGSEVGLLVQQGATALSRGFLDKNLDRITAQIAGFRILQLTAPNLAASIGDNNEEGSP
jgi:ERCC4-related helicase